MARFLYLIIFICFSSHADILPVEAFASLPSASQVKLSPDGKKMAYLANAEGETYIVSVDLNTGEEKHLLSTDNKAFKLEYYQWANNEIMLVSANYSNRGLGIKFGKRRLLKLPADGNGKAEPVLTLRHNDLNPQFQDTIVDLLPQDADHILMSLKLENAHYPSVYKVNLTDAKLSYKRVKKWHLNTIAWKTDRQHRVRLGLSRDKTTGFFRLLDLQTNQWRRIWDYEIFEQPGIVPLGFAADPNQLYVRADHNGRYGIFKVDVSQADLPRELVFADPKYDVEGALIYSQTTNDVIGIFHSEAEGGKVFFDKEYQNFQHALDQTMPDAYNRITSFSADEGKYILFSSNSKQSGAYYIGDRTTQSLNFVVEQYPQLYKQPLSGKQKITYRARDNLEIEAYLTLTRGGIKADNPAIIIPHGGPMMRDYANFDWFIEFFASRGYVVMQPNFCGSSGYGFDFKMQGIQDWGGAMQDDLADAATWLIANRSVDSQSICILGTSYGGYAAQMAAAKQQNVFKCAASFAGISDLQLLLSKASRNSNYDLVKRQLGTDKRKLSNRSPITFVEQINTPLLLLHGDQDNVVSVEQSRIMYAALQEHNKHVEYIELQGGDHYMSTEQNRAMVLSSLQHFLNQHIPVEIDS